MRPASFARRLAPALLAALVVVASIASAAHTHATPPNGGALTAHHDAALHANPADLGCALCAHAERSAHGAVQALASPLGARGARSLPDGAESTPPKLTLLERLAPRAPPRIG
jgi:hypothetical protein